MSILIGITGKLNVGKDQFAQYLAEEFRDRGYKPEIKKFAGKLKAIASLLTGIPAEKWEDRAFKESSLGPEWDHMSVRSFLQKLGTEAVRDGLYKNAWVNALFADFKEDSCWIVSDMRFPNEMEAIIHHGGICVRVLRETGNTDTHPSETALDGYRMKEIPNDGTLQQLRRFAEVEVKDLLEYKESIPWLV